ncbi:BspA family leucine-rich repeat surface protein [Lactobacillus mellis]|nr:BspA family leucine-rich repeat surface protein [Bombilactobacillus mellis]
MKPNNKHLGLVLSSTFVGLVCGLVLTHQQAYAAQTSPVSNQQSQITTVSDNNMSQTAAVNPKSYSSNISYPTPVSHNVTPNTYNSPETGRQQIANSDVTAAAPTPNTGATVPVANETATATNSGNNNSTNPATSSPSQDISNSASTPVAASDNQTNGNSTNTSTSSEQPETNIIAQGTWGTSKWDYTQEGADYILHLHAGTLGTPGKDKYDNGYIWDAGIGSLNTAFKSQLTQIIIDPGVIANQNSRGLFSYLRKLKTIQGLENLDTSQVTNMSSMFANCYNLTSLDVSPLDTSQVTNMSAMFQNCQSLTGLDVSHLDTSQVTNMSWMFAGCDGLTSLDVSHFDTSKVTNMARMFSDCDKLTSLNLSHLDTSQVTDMSGMFYRFFRLTNLDLSDFNTSQVTDMSDMFGYCTSLTNLDLSHFDTSQVTNISGMFEWCTCLTNLDLSHFDTSKVTNMAYMFDECQSLTSLDLSHFNTSHVTTMSGMFIDCRNLTSLDLSNWDTSQVTDMSNMFAYCGILPSLDVSHFDTSHVTTMSEMFADCKNLTSLDLSSFDTSQLDNSPWHDFSMLEYCTNLHHLVLGPKTKLIDQNGWDSALPTVPAAGTKIPGTDRVVTAPYWVATSGYQQGKRYTSRELEQITGRDQVTTYDWDSQPLFASTVATKAVIRTINVHNPDGTMQTEHQIATLTQEIKNNADGTQTLGPWSTGQWQAYAVPEITGYTADPTEVAAQTVTDSTVNQTIDVYYEPVVQQITVNYLENGKIVGTQILTGYAGETIIPQYRAPKGYEIIDRPQGELTFSTDKQQIVQIPVQAQIIPTSESKVLIRTVNIHLPSGNLKTYRQPVVLTRTVYLNAVSGEKTYDSWSTGHWGAITVPVVAGYTASQAQVAVQTVTAQDSDQQLDIYYTKA